MRSNNYLKNIAYLSLINGVVEVSKDGLDNPFISKIQEECKAKFKNLKQGELKNVKRFSSNLFKEFVKLTKDKNSNDISKYQESLIYLVVNVSFVRFSEVLPLRGVPSKTLDEFLFFANADLMIDLSDYAKEIGGDKVDEAKEYETACKIAEIF